MNEKYQTRREVMAEQIEQDEKYHAMQTLLNLGICKKVSDLELHHGRAGDGDEWSIDPSFNNSANNTGNSNINKVAALSTSTDYEIASEFAAARAKSGGIPEINKIVSNDPDAMIACSSGRNLNDQDKERFKEALTQLCPTIMAGAPVDFQHRNDIRGVKPREFLNPKYHLMLQDDINTIVKKTGLDQDLVTHIGSALNTRSMLEHGYLSQLCNAFLKNKPFLEFEDSENRSQRFILPINQEYLSNFFRSSHIIGALMPVYSATLGKNIDNYLLFDLAKINTPEAVDNQKNARNKIFGKIASAASEKLTSDNTLLNELKTNLYIKPQEIITLSKRTPGFEKVFDEDCGNWEGFKLGEHTETTLRLFDDNFADIMPASTLPLMRLALLVHDLGKPEAARRNDKINQKQYNLGFAEKFMRQNDVDFDTRFLIRSMIGEGMTLTSELIMDRGNVVSKWKFHYFCERIARGYLNTDQVDDDTIQGFKNMLMVLQTCDSAAYTTMAVTRTKGGIRYRNHGSFNSSFEDYKGFTGKRARLKPL